MPILEHTHAASKTCVTAVGARRVWDLQRRSEVSMVEAIRNDWKVEIVL